MVTAIKPLGRDEAVLLHPTEVAVAEGTLANPLFAYRVLLATAAQQATFDTVLAQNDKRVEFDNPLDEVESRFELQREEARFYLQVQGQEKNAEPDSELQVVEFPVAPTPVALDWLRALIAYDVRTELVWRARGVEGQDQALSEILSKHVQANDDSPF